MSRAVGPFSGKEWKRNARNTADVYHNYWFKYSESAMNMFEYKGLPPSVSEKYLEKALFETGQACFFDHEQLGFMILKCTAIRYNAYGEPIVFDCYGVNTPRYRRNVTDGVLISNNYERLPTAITVDHYCERLEKIQKTIDINMDAQKTPIVIECESQKDLQSLMNIYKQYDSGRPVIFAKGTAQSMLNVLKTDAPYLIDKLYTYKQQVESELMSLLGINHNPIVDKKERLNLDETNSNTEMVEMSGDVMLTCRKKAVERINELFGLNISVDYRNKERREQLEVYGGSNQENGGGDGGEVYD